MSEPTKRPLSWYAANRCENAEHPKCRCRCRGKLHGAARAKPHDLPTDDPHFALVHQPQDETTNRRIHEAAGQATLFPLDN